MRRIVALVGDGESTATTVVRRADRTTIGWAVVGQHHRASPGAGLVEDGGGAAGPLGGQIVVVTGSMAGSPLDGLSRNEVNELIERAGGKASSSVSRKTTLLVAGEKAGSKRGKAEELGIRIVTPEEFAVTVADHLT